ncbi:MAG: Lrp/AsnC family transcriptional regulator [Candidatus Woesearchaeota archaeon]
MLSRHQRELIEQLRKNSREKLSVLAKELNTPLSTVHDRLYKLLREKTIRLVSLTDFNQLNKPLQAWIVLKAKNKEATQEFLEQTPIINTCYAISNGADFLFEALFSCFKEYDEFINTCKEHGKTQAHPILEVVCKETAKL